MTLQALRTRQWTKNLVLFAPLVFAQRALDKTSLSRALLGFAAFCGLAGAIYVLNDLRDRERDRLHPTKRHRPFASGRLGLGQGLVLGASALALALGIAAALGPSLVTTVTPIDPSSPGLLSHNGHGPSFLTICLAYLLLFAAYSLGLKNIVILDVLVVASGFVLRAVAGAVVIGVDMSHWLLVCTVFLALFLSLAKRRHEVVLLDEDASGHRSSLKDYDVAGLDQMISIVAAATLMAYALYTTAEETVAKFGTTRLSLTIPFVIYGIFRYIYLVRLRGDGGDPTQTLVSDRPLLLAVAFWGLASFVIVYL